MARPRPEPRRLSRGTRQNAHGIDLNRNFSSEWKSFGTPWSVYAAGPRPFSEPETRAARDLIRRIQPRYTVWYHQHLDVLWADGRSTAADKRYAKVAGMRLLHRRWLAGSATNWQNHLKGGGASLTVKLPAGSLDANGIKRHVAAVLGLSLA